MQIKYLKNFIKRFEKCPSNIKKSFKERMLIFLINKNEHVLNNHALSGDLKHCRSININGDWRAVFKEDEVSGIIYFINIGTHSDLYS